MKLYLVSSRTRYREAGSATVLVFALITILVIYLNGNQRALHTAKRELRLLEERQLKKFQAPPRSSNLPAAAKVEQPRK